MPNGNPVAWVLSAFLALSSGCASARGSHPGPLASDAAVDAGAPAPAPLRSLESNAEGCGEAARAGDWAKAEAILGEANANWSLLQPEVVTKGAAQETVKTIGDALIELANDIQGKSSRATQNASNVISTVVPDLFELYVFAVPAEALRLDAGFRQLQIDADFSDWQACGADVQLTSAIWKRLRPLAQSQAPNRADIGGSQSVVADIDAAIAAAQSAIDAKAQAGAQDAAQKGLDLVDTVEQIFQ